MTRPAGPGALGAAWRGIAGMAAFGARLAGTWAGLTGDAGRALDWAERLAFPASLRDAPRDVIWLHGASVGEIRALAPLARAIAHRHADVPLVVTASTAAGRQRADQETPGTARLAPLDAPGPVQRFIAAFRPRLHVIVETEIWPTRLHALRRAGVPAALVSARLSPERAKRYSRLSSLYGPCLRGLALLAPASAADRDRLVAAGADPERIRAEGNLKWDAAPSVPTAAEIEATRSGLGIGAERAWIVLGSVHRGEGRAVIEATESALGGTVDVGWIVAPRHFDRYAAELEAIERTGGTWRASQGPAPAGTRIVVLDRIGVLQRVYPLARAGLLGGSLVPVGGHTPLEAAAGGCPLVAGPHVGHQQDLLEPLVARGGVVPSADAAAAGRTLARWVRDPAAARAAGLAARGEVERRRGVSERLAAALAELLR